MTGAVASPPRRLSVVIPTRDRPVLLADCLRTLAAQEIDPGVLDVVVVDDGSSEDLGPHVAPVRGGRVPVRVVRQSPAGLNAARDRGVAECRGDVVCFLDDDTLVSPGWASAIHDAFRDWGCAGLAGRIELAFEAPVPRWLTPARRRYLSELDLGDQAAWLPAAEVPVGANCAVLRSVHAEIGGFREGLDREADSLVSNGDVDFFARVRARGGRLAYAPQAHVRHRVPAERLEATWFHRRAYAQGLSDELVREPAHGVRRTLRLAREATRFGRAAPILARRLTEGRGSEDAHIWVSYCRGRFAGARDGGRPYM